MGSANEPVAGWWERFPGAITVSDNNGVILMMNEASARHYARFGGIALIGTNMLDCHPEPARTKVAHMLANPGSNVYTTEKAGVRRLVYQTTWYEGDTPAGLVELILELPGDMEHFLRDG
ncbi:MAG: diguanylate cyclase [Chthonomonadales bacterium]|nr:diguanylate cyclase [Chthonomonadales bacterium]